MRLWLAPQIFMATVEEDIVVLDVGADRYQCLLGATQWMLLEADGSLIVGDEQIGDELLTAGLSVLDRPAALRTPIVRPSREQASSSATRIEVVRAALSLSVASLRFRRQNFQSLATSVRCSGDKSRLPAAGRLAASLSAAEQVFPWLPGEGECLQRAYQLRHFLADRDLSADWVFGVRTWPFSAHCWLQIGNEVLGDRIERVRLYTPIMVV